MTGLSAPDVDDIEGRFQGNLPRTDAETAAALIDDDATLVMSGFGSVGYPKEVPLALADADRDFELTVITSGNVGDEIDITLVKSGAISRRSTYQSPDVAREATNSRRIAFTDRP